MAGAKSPQLQTEAEMLKVIREAGRVPVQRNTFYEPIKTWEGEKKADDASGQGSSEILEKNLATA
jgi:aminodeoxyfutalosine synthase